MSSQNKLLLEHRVSELELELSRLRREIQQRPQVATPPPPTKYAPPPPPQTLIHQRRQYAFEARMPTVRKIIDYRVTNKKTGDTLTLDEFSPAQIEKAAYKFSKLASPTRALWRGDRALYGAMRKLFEHFGAIVLEPQARTWVWGIWAHQRRDVAREIVASLTQK